ncbi:hypothetical protein [Streptomyces sp. NPDC005336]|uniref:hypothetical protein n=1 Tax=Streptomyces sp. NPDC005336 TaxID=3157035 RepID=UPI0033ABC656
MLREASTAGRSAADNHGTGSGLAAVLGAAAGAVGGVFGSLVTGKVQRDGVLISVRAEHLKERRQPRHEVYKAFIQSLTTLKDRVLAENYENTRAEEEDAFRKEINARWIDVSLLGPIYVNSHAVEVRDLALVVVNRMGAARECASVLLRLNGDEGDDVFEHAERSAGHAVDSVRAHAELLGATIDAFSVTASEALNDDGTKRRLGLRERMRRFRPLIPRQGFQQDT